VIFDKKSIEVHKFWLAQPMRADGDALGERMVKFKGRKLGERGQSMVEFAFGLPVLLLALIGVVMMGVAFNNQIALTFAAGIGAQQLSISRGQTTDPCSLASTAFENAAPSLNPSNLKFTIVLGGNSYSGTCATLPKTPCASDGNSCTSASLVQAETAQVTATYPCNLQVLNFNPVPTCLLTAQTSVYIQ